MEDDHNGGAAAAVVVARPPSSDTCGMIVNHGDRTATQPPPPPAAAAAVATAAAAFGAPPRAAPPHGVHPNNNNNNNNSVIKTFKAQHVKGPGNPDHRTKRPRRGKRKRSKKIMPYTTDRVFRYKAVAPNNTNQFLMDDHNDGPDIDKQLSARYNNENGRTRNSSFTSIESDGEYIYSSSDDEGSSIQKEFIDTYRLVQEEELAGLNHEELTQRVIELEEKVQMLESTKRYRKNIMSYVNDLTKGVVGEEDSIDPEEYRLMQIKIRELTTQNKMLQTEIDTLKQVQARKNDSDSSVDSESSSDSSDSSSSSSDGQEIEMQFLLCSGQKDETQCDIRPKDK